MKIIKGDWIPTSYMMFVQTEYQVELCQVWQNKITLECEWRQVTVGMPDNINIKIQK